MVTYAGMRQEALTDTSRGSESLPKFTGRQIILYQNHGKAETYAMHFSTPPVRRRSREFSKSWPAVTYVFDAVCNMISVAGVRFAHDTGRPHRPSQSALLALVHTRFRL